MIKRKLERTKETHTSDWETNKVENNSSTYDNEDGKKEETVNALDSETVNARDSSFIIY